MIARSSLARITASVILAGSLLVGTAGCTLVSTQATLIQYDPSDGIGAEVGDIKLRNVFVLLSEDGSTASVLLTAINEGDSRVNLSLQYEAGGTTETETLSVAGGSTLSRGNFTDEPQLLIVEPAADAGALYPIYIQYGDEPGSEMLVPVLEGTLPEYEDLVPDNAE